MSRSLIEGQTEPMGVTPTPCGPCPPAALVRSIEGELVPRLLLHAASRRRKAAHGEADWRPTAADVVEFTALLIDHEATVAAAYVDAQLQQGAALSTLYLELLAPAAGYVGRLRQERRFGYLRLLLARYRLLRVMHFLRRRRPVMQWEPAAGQH
jgi:hypothetical protein